MSGVHVAGVLKLPKSKQAEIDAFVSQMHGFGMQMKGMLMMQNLKGLETLSSSIIQTATQHGFVDLVKTLSEIEGAAKNSDFSKCMLYVSAFETEFHALKIEYV